MAGLLNSAIQVFDRYSYKGRTIVENQVIDDYSAKSNGAIVIERMAPEGEFEHMAGWNKVPDLVRNIDIQPDIGDETPVKLTEYDEKAVQVVHSSKTVSFEEIQIEVTNRDPATAGSAWGRQVGIAALRNKFNNAVAAAAGSILSAGLTGGLTLDKSGTTASASNQINADMLLECSGIMGDHFQEIRSWLMHSQAFIRFARNNLKDYQRLFQYKGVTIMEDLFGKQFFITDDPSLQFSQNSLVKYRTFGLLEGAIKVYDPGYMRNNIQVNNKTRIETTLKTESRFGLRVRGFGWNTQKYPTILQVATTGNWTRTANTDNADGPGVCLLHQV